MFSQIKLFSLLLILALVVAACGGQATPEAATEPAAQATEAPAEATQAIPETGPTAEPTSAPTEAATEAPTEAPTEAATEEPAAAGPQRAGLLRFRDNEFAPSGSAELAMEGVSPPPAGSHYELWVSDESHNVLDLGALPAGADVAFTATADQNLIGSYNSAFVSIEPDGPADAQIGPNAFRGVIPPAALVHVRHVVFQFADNPGGKGFLVGAGEQLALATEHAGLLREALAADNLAGGKQHAEHVVNILDGEAGATFGDLDGDGVAQNPGDGFGVRAWLEGAKQHAQLAADSEDATAEVELHAGHTIISSDNVLAGLDEAIDQAVRVISSDSAQEAQTGSGELDEVLALMLNGQDLNGDGAVAPIEGEGGLLTASEHALYMGSVELFPVEVIDTGAAPEEQATPGTEAAATEAAPAATEAPATEAAPAQAPAPVTIEMSNFSYQPGDITVPVGTTVTWVNKDAVRHSATAVDGSFDTGLFEGGGQASVTFDTPGTFSYYCQLHGDPQGGGMSATITVTGDQGAAAPQPTAAPPPAPAAPQPVTIVMQDFQYDQPNLTVPAGTTVTWVNQGTKRHSATADDGSFNTGLFDPGGSGSVTLNTPGTFAYYCELHGGPGGQGMAATITVTGGSSSSDYQY